MLFNLDEAEEEDLANADDNVGYGRFLGGPPRDVHGPTGSAMIRLLKNHDPTFNRRDPLIFLVMTRAVVVRRRAEAGGNARSGGGSGTLLVAAEAGRSV